MEIGKKLKNARVQSGMTQENVAEKINVSRQTISNWENEKSYPDIISVIELQDLYGRVGVVQIHPVFEELLHAFDTRPPVQRNEVE